MAGSFDQVDSGVPGGLVLVGIHSLETGCAALIAGNSGGS
jgi:hypothetical protein